MLVICRISNEKVHKLNAVKLITPQQKRGFYIKATTYQALAQHISNKQLLTDLLALTSVYFKCNLTISQSTPTKSNPNKQTILLNITNQETAQRLATARKNKQAFKPYGTATDTGKNSIVYMFDYNGLTITVSTAIHNGAKHHSKTQLFILKNRYLRQYAYGYLLTTHLARKQSHTIQANIFESVAHNIQANAIALNINNRQTVDTGQMLTQYKKYYTPKATATAKA